MSGISVTPQFGIVVRRAAMRERGIELRDVLEALEADAPLDSDEHLLSFGPSFGEEAGDEFVRRLQMLGLDYVDDFFVFFVDVPSWCRFQAYLGDDVE
jgi:hypothetical protein